MTSLRPEQHMECTLPTQGNTQTRNDQQVAKGQPLLLLNEPHVRQLNTLTEGQHRSVLNHLDLIKENNNTPGGVPTTTTAATRRDTSATDSQRKVGVHPARDSRLNCDTANGTMGYNERQRNTETHSGDNERSPEMDCNEGLTSIQETPSLQIVDHKDEGEHTQQQNTEEACCGNRSDPKRRRAGRLEERTTEANRDGTDSDDGTQRIETQEPPQRQVDGYPDHRSEQCQRSQIKILRARLFERDQNEQIEEEAEPPSEWNPTHPCNWLGSNFDAAGPKPGCVRLLSLNTRIMSHSDEGVEDQERMWDRIFELQVGAVGLSDVALQDCSVAEPRGSLFRSTQTARRHWKSPNMTVTHAQGRPGVMRDVVGGNLLATNDTVSTLLGQDLSDDRKWGRWAGRRLVGANGRSILLYQAYFPTFANSDHPGSAWQTQLKLMASITSEDRETDPWLQALADLSARITEDMMTESLRVAEGTLVILTGDLNARWIEHVTGSAQSRARTAALRHFARTYGLCEALTTLYPGMQPVTFVASENVGARTSWIDHMLVSAELLDDGYIVEAGILLHEQLNSSDHRAVVIEVDIANALQIGPEWSQKPTSDPRLPKLNIKNEQHVSQYQHRVAKQYTRLKIAHIQARAEAVVKQWTEGEATDESTLAILDEFYDAIIVLLGSWRTAAGFLPSVQRTGGSRKNIWSVEYVAKAREFRVLKDIVHMWKQQYPKSCILARLEHANALASIAAAAPTEACDHVVWRDWIAWMDTKATAKRKELHGSWRIKARESMLGAIKARSDGFLRGAQRSAISSWLNRARRAQKMRSIQTVGAEGKPTMTTEPTKLKELADNAFEKRAAGGYGPSRWYEGHPLDSATVEGNAMRIALAEFGIAGIDTQGIPPYLEYVLDEAQHKFVPSLGGPASPDPYLKRGLMEPLSPQAWTEYWAHRRKGTAPGQSQLSVNLMWALQLRVQQSPEKRKENEARAKLRPLSKEQKAALRADKTCITEHCFDAARVLCNLVMETALVPTGMLRVILCLLDKIAGCHKMSNKRPIGLVEQLAQAILGPQFRIIEDVWDEHRMLDTIQSGGSRGTGCDVPVMSVIGKMEHAWIYKHYLALIFQDQSKAFETLHRYLGQEIPLRRLGIPESFLRLHGAFKGGTWIMVQTAWGPREGDWQLVVGQIVDGANTLSAMPPGPDDLQHRQIGFHDEHGTTQGGAGGPTTYRAYYDWFATLHRRLQKYPAPYTGPDGRDQTSPGHGFIDDVCMTVMHAGGVVRSIEISRDFNEVMDGAFNIDKTYASIVDYTDDGTLKLQCPEGAAFNHRVHIPNELQIPNKAAIYRQQCLQNELATLPALDSEGRRDLLSEIAGLESALTLTIPVKGPHDPCLYLGVWITPSLYYDSALAAAKECTDLAAAAIRTTSIKPKEAQELARMVPQAQAVYKLKCTALLPEDMESVDTKLRTAIKTKSGLCSKFANRAFHGTLYEGINNAVLAERIMMLLRLIHMNNPVSDLMQGSLWRYQRWLGTSTPALEYEFAEEIGWDGTWIAALGIWLARTSLTILGGTGLQPMCTADVCLVDLANLDMKQMVSRGCWNREIWRVSELTDACGHVRAECLEGGAWGDDENWITEVIKLYEEWLWENDMESGWKREASWNLDTILEHDLIASHDASGDPVVGKIHQTYHSDDGMKVAVKWLKRAPRSEAYDQADANTRGWLDMFGGKGTTEAARSRRSQRIIERCPAEQRRIGLNAWSSWVWGEPSEGYTTVNVNDIVPVRTAQQVAEFEGEMITLTVIAETGDWGCPVQWEAAKALWTPDLTPVANTTYAGTTLTLNQLQRRSCTWSDTIWAANTESVLYGYSDCSKVKVGPRQVLSYGWLTAGLADPQLVEDRPDGTWEVMNSDDDFGDLRPGLWGGAIVQGPKQELTTYRGEAMGALGVMAGVRMSGYPGRLVVTLDNKAVVDKFDGRQIILHGSSGPMEDERPSAPCLDDLADSDLWAEIDAERRRWGGRLKLKWIRSHPENRKAKVAWTRHEHANSWSDWQADDIREADPEGTRGIGDRFQLAPASGTGAWGVAWQGERIVSGVNKAIRAALKADSFAEYLKVNRGWEVTTVGAFSKDRWASRLVSLRNLANATVVTKMITGWLASQSVLLKRSRSTNMPDLPEAEADPNAIPQGTCRLCGVGEETNWHVQAECTHPEVVAERRAVSERIRETISKLSLPAGAEQLLSTNWLLDAQGKAHDLSDMDNLDSVLQQWAPDISLKAQEVQERLGWASLQGPWKDDLRKWSFRGVLLNHWSTTMVELGCTPADAQAALLELETTIMKTVPDIWNIFSAEVHADGGADASRITLEQEVEDFFQDWARDQGPIPVTRGYVRTLTMRAKKRWLRARKRELRRRRKDDAAASSGSSGQIMITRYFQQQEVPQEVRERLQAARYLRVATRGRTKRKRWRQSILRDAGYEPTSGQACPREADPDCGVQSQCPQPLAQPMMRPQAGPVLHRVPRWGGSTGRRSDGGPPPGDQSTSEALRNPLGTGEQRQDPPPTTNNFPTPAIHMPPRQEDTQYAIFDRG